MGNLTVKHGATWAVFGRRPLLMRARGMARGDMMDRAFGVMEEEAALPDDILLKGVPVALNAMPREGDGHASNASNAREGDGSCPCRACCACCA